MAEWVRTASEPSEVMMWAVALRRARQAVTGACACVAWRGAGTEGGKERRQARTRRTWKRKNLVYELRHSTTVTTEGGIDEGVRDETREAEGEARGEREGRPTARRAPRSALCGLPARRLRPTLSGRDRVGRNRMCVRVCSDACLRTGSGRWPAY